MPTFYGAIDLTKNELRNAAIQSLGSAPSSPVKFQMYGNSSDNTLYWWDGTQWIAAKAAAGAVPSDTVTTQAVGDAPAAGASTLFSRGDHKHGREGFGNVVGEPTFGSASANGAAATVARSDHAHGNPVHDSAAHSAIPLSALAAPTTNVSFGGFRITNLGTPSTNTDAATRQYVDDAVAGLAWKDAVTVRSTANIAALSGLLTIDGVTLTSFDRVLVMNQTTASQNGIYQAASGAWARTTDANTAAELEGSAVFVMRGTTYAATSWVLTTQPPITVDVTSLTYAQFGASTSYIGGAGMSLNGNTFDVGAGSGIVVMADNIQIDPTVVATTGTTVTAGAGLTGGGTLAANRTIDFAAGDTSLTVAADNVVVNTAVIATVASTMSKLTPTATKTGNYTAAVGELVICDVSTANLTVTLPTAPLDGSEVGVFIRASGSTYTVTIQRGGSDSIITGIGSTTAFVYAAGSGMRLRYQSSTTSWLPAATPYAPNTPLNVFGAPLNSVNMGLQRVASVGTATAGDDAVSRNYGDGRYTQLATLTAKGDIYAATAAGVVARQGVGTDGQVLIADSAQVSGLRWGAATAAGTVIKYATALAGTASPETITHNLNTRDIHLSVYNGATPYTAVEVDWDATTVNTATVRYSPNLGAGYRVVVMG